MKPPKDSVDAARLSAALLAVVSDKARASLEREDLEHQLQSMFDDGASAWPDIVVSPEQFVRFVADRLPDEDPWEALCAMRGADLYLACACAEHDERAASVFKTVMFPQIAVAIRRLDPGRQLLDDVQQMVFQKVFVAADRGPPKISQYRGRGALQSWIRVVALRTAQNLLATPSRREVPGHTALIDEVGSSEDGELSYLAKRYRPAFREAFKGALASLTSEQRNILRYRVHERLAVDQIATIFGVHRVTMTRRIRKIHDAVLARTRSNLAAELRATPEDVSSVMRLVTRSLDMTLDSFLAGPEE